MKNYKEQDSKEKKIWETPQINVISGLDSCVEFLYLAGGGKPLDNDLPPN
mgnify:CR=1 FL=1